MVAPYNDELFDVLDSILSQFMGRGGEEARAPTFTNCWARGAP